MKNDEIGCGSKTRTRMVYWVASSSYVAALVVVASWFMSTLNYYSGLVSARYI